MKTTDVAFQIIYRPALISEVLNLMKHMDLGLDDIHYPVIEKISWTTTTKVTPAYLTEMKRLIKKAYTQQGCKVYSLEKLKSE